MPGLRRSLFLITLPLVTLGCLVSIDTAKGQIIPDNSLNAERSVVNSNTNTDRINGGARRGSNLFHSFQEFSVREGRAALFSNPAGIENIFSRVTGDRRSDILGTLGVADGNANLFFMNPNGIFFGQNARLDLRGSFLASTANSLLFDGGLEFSASNPQAPPMLAINIPIGLQFRENLGSITNRSVADDVGLQVASGKTLSFVDGEINLDGGRLTASGGLVELGGLAKPGTVALASDGRLSFPDGVARGNVSLANGAQVDVTAGGGGSVNIYAQNLDILGNSAVCAGIGATWTCGARASNFGSVESKAGDVTLNALGILTIQGSRVENDVKPDAIGQGGNINITTGILSLSDRAQLSASTGGQGNAGNVRVSAKDAVSLADNAAILSTVEAGGVGKGGNIDINAATLSLIDGAQLQTITRAASATQPAGRGDAGNVNVNVTGAVDIAGEKNDLPSAIFSRVETGTVGNGGNITIDSGSFSLSDRAQLSASTSGQGNAGNVRVSAKDAVSLADNAYILSTVEAGGVGKGGNIDINAATLSLIDGAQLLTLTRAASATQPAGRGNAGNVNVNVTGAVDIAGEKGLPSAIFSRVETGTVGNGGNITIDSGSFSLRDRAQLNATSFENGAAGNITATTIKDIRLDSKALISADTQGGQGNITLHSRDLILRDHSNITTNARGPAKGGNITIKTENLVAVPKEDSNISADAEKYFGGEVKITAQGIFGIKSRQRPTLESDITASSELGPEFSGEVKLNLPNVDPSHGLVELPKNVVDPTEQIAQNPCQRGVGSKFIITGRGGLPPSPNEATSSDAVRVDLVEPAPVEDKKPGEQRGRGAEEKTKSSVSKPIVPAQGWILDKNGEVMLTAYDPTGTGDQRPLNSDACPVP